MSDQRANTPQSPASLRGHFLMATPVIGSGFFNRSLTYLVTMMNMAQWALS